MVTGNIRAVAETKLAVFGLDTYIRFRTAGTARTTTTAPTLSVQPWPEPPTHSDTRSTPPMCY
ncbi:hypothetical protein GCM10009647_070710 [Streptomyces sanglieri]